MFINDRQITISEVKNRKDTHVQPSTIYVSEYTNKMSIPCRSTESLNAYIKSSKSVQDNLKDVGGHVDGIFKGNIRKGCNLIGRDTITLDLDNIQPGGTQDLIRRVDGLECFAIIHSTRKHEESKPRLRLIIPLNRTVTADQYEPLARMTGKIAGVMEMCDPSTFEVSRLMYWPSCCSDSQYVFKYWDKPFIDADSVLAMYSDWHDMSEWPRVPGEQKQHVATLAKQADPTTKDGVIGAFCRTYDVYRAMEVFLPCVYEPCDNDEGRFTYTKGSTTGGAIVYDNGKFLFSHHATDPAGGKLCNSFDLVRLHKFSELDDDSLSGTPVNKLPSYKAMCEFAVKDVNVSALIDQERYEEAKESFSVELENDIEWAKKLKLNSNGIMKNTYSNIKIIIENDPNLKGKIIFDEFSNRANIIGTLPWSRPTTKSYLIDSDITNLCEYIEKTRGITISDDRLRKVLKASIEGNAVNPPKEYLKSLRWDGTERVDTLLIDYFGAEDTEYTRIVMRKWLCGAVARIFEPGIKFDYMLVLIGDQGVGKSTFFQKLGKNWFTDSIQDVEGNQAIEKIIGSWIIEFGELQAFNKMESRALKRFIAATDDKTRLAFARNTEYFKRQCVFAGTTNEEEFLKDDTGNRRYWPVNFKGKHITKILDSDDFENSIDQIWAEAVYKWKDLKEPLFLTKEQEELAIEQQNKHTVTDDRKGLIVEYLDKLLPDNWDELPIYQRVSFINDSISTQGKVLRDKVCILEIWVECLNKNKSDIKRADSNAIASIMNTLEEWEKAGYSIRFGPYGNQKGYIRKNNLKG